MLPSEVTVLRDGQFRAIPAAALVPGDVVQIRAGNKIPADLRLVEVSSDLKFNRSILTGEANAIKASINSTSDNFLEVNAAEIELTERLNVSQCRVLIASLGPELASVFSLATTPSLAKSPNSPQRERLD